MRPPCHGRSARAQETCAAVRTVLGLISAPVHCPTRVEERYHRGVFFVELRMRELDARGIDLQIVVVRAPAAARAGSDPNESRGQC
jgi:hypothetical protein